MDDLEAMSINDLISHKLALHEEEDAVREKLRAAEAVLARKLEMERAEQALRNAGVTGVVISPAPAVMTTTPAEVQ